MLFISYGYNIIQLRYWFSHNKVYSTQWNFLFFHNNTTLLNISKNPVHKYYSVFSIITNYRTSFLSETRNSTHNNRIQIPKYIYSFFFRSNMYNFNMILKSEYSRSLFVLFSTFCFMYKKVNTFSSTLSVSTQLHNYNALITNFIFRNELRFFYKLRNYNSWFFNWYLSIFNSLRLYTNRRFDERLEISFSSNINDFHLYNQLLWKKVLLKRLPQICSTSILLFDLFLPHKRTDSFFDTTNSFLEHRNITYSNSFFFRTKNEVGMHKYGISKRKNSLYYSLDSFFRLVNLFRPENTNKCSSNNVNNLRKWHIHIRPFIIKSMPFNDEIAFADSTYSVRHYIWMINKIKLRRLRKKILRRGGTWIDRPDPRPFGSFFFFNCNGIDNINRVYNRYKYIQYRKYVTKYTSNRLHFKQFETFKKVQNTMRKFIKYIRKKSPDMLVILNPKKIKLSDTSFKMYKRLFYTTSYGKKIYGYHQNKFKNNWLVTNQSHRYRQYNLSKNKINWLLGQENISDKITNFKINNRGIVYSLSNIISRTYKSVICPEYDLHYILPNNKFSFLYHSWSKYEISSFSFPIFIKLMNNNIILYFINKYVSDFIYVHYSLYILVNCVYKYNVTYLIIAYETIFFYYNSQLVKYRFCFDNIIWTYNILQLLTHSSILINKPISNLTFRI